MTEMAELAAGRGMRVVDAALWFLEVSMRVPLKFGAQTVESVTCARASVRVRGRRGGEGGEVEADGWGETPLSVAWVWPSELAYAERAARLRGMAVAVGRELKALGDWSGHAFEFGHRFVSERLPGLERAEAAAYPGAEPVPHLAALVAYSAFDLALHDAYGNLHGVPVYETYGEGWIAGDLSCYLEPAAEGGVGFGGRFPGDFLTARRDRLPVWHLVGGLDPLDSDELTGAEPDDGYPVTLREWVRRDGLDCLKVKLRGDDERWDFERITKVGKIAREEGATFLSADFNCTVTDPAYVNGVLDRLARDEPAVSEALLYVEQPFPYDLAAHRIDVSSVSLRKPLYLDESAHDWTYVRMGRELGWTGVALKTCKTQTGALLSLAWAKAHGMGLMVQDLTNPMLAQVPHVLLAAHAGTIKGVESNGMQFYPEASLPEAAVHPGLYRRRDGVLDAGTVSGPGFGYRLGEIARELPAPALAWG